MYPLTPDTPSLPPSPPTLPLTLSGRFSAYCVGQLRLPECPLPWEGAAGTEEETWAYTANLAHPRRILVEASNGAR